MNYNNVSETIAQPTRNNERSNDKEVFTLFEGELYHIPWQFSIDGLLSIGRSWDGVFVTIEKAKDGYSAVLEEFDSGEYEYQWFAKEISYEVALYRARRRLKREKDIRSKLNPFQLGDDVIPDGSIPISKGWVTINDGQTLIEHQMEKLVTMEPEKYAVVELYDTVDGDAVVVTIYEDGSEVERWSRIDEANPERHVKLGIGLNKAETWLKR